MNGIGLHFDLHYSTVSRIIRRGEIVARNKTPIVFFIRIETILIMKKLPSNIVFSLIDFYAISSRLLVSLNLEYRVVHRYYRKFQFV